MSQENNLLAEKDIEQPERVTNPEEGPESLKDLKSKLEHEIAESLGDFKQDDQKVTQIEKSIQLENPDAVKEIEGELKVPETLSALNSEAESLAREFETQGTDKGGFSFEDLLGNEENFKKAREDEKRFQFHLNKAVESGTALSAPELRFAANFKTLITTEQYEGFNEYKLHNGHTVMNGILRKGNDVTIENVLSFKGLESSEWNREINAGLVECFNTLKEGMGQSYLLASEKEGTNKVYRFVKGTPFGDNKEIGEVVTEKSFLSTSVDSAYADYYLNNDQEETILQMEFPDNSVVHGVMMGGVEKEFLLPPNMAYKIKNKEVREVNGIKKVILAVEFLPNENLLQLASPDELERVRKM